MAWKERDYPTGSQDIVPMDRKLGKKIGLSRDDKILVFAGGIGNWASELSKFTRVEYTDSSREMRKTAQTRYPGRVVSFRVAEAGLVPRKSSRYDWSFSFEPIPLTKSEFHPTQFELSLVRSLLNNKGAKLVFGMERMKTHEPILKAFLSKLKEIYGVESESRNASIQTVDGKTNITVIDFLTNARARQKAVLDLSVLKVLNLKENYVGPEPKRLSTAEIAQQLKRFGVNATVSQVNASRQRLERLSQNWASWL